MNLKNLSILHFNPISSSRQENVFLLIFLISLTHSSHFPAFSLEKFRTPGWKRCLWNSSSREFCIPKFHILPPPATPVTHNQLSNECKGRLTHGAVVEGAESVLEREQTFNLQTGLLCNQRNLSELRELSARLFGQERDVNFLLAAADRAGEE